MPHAPSASMDDHPAAVIAALRHAGHLNEAGDACRRWIRRAPRQWEAHFELGHVLRQAGRMADAREAYATAVHLRPDHPPALLCLGAARRACGDPQGALDCYRQAVALRPDYPEALNNMSVVLTDMGRIGEAMDCCRRALAAKPDMGPAMNNMARACKYGGRIREAIAWYEKALRAAPGDNAVASNYLYSLCYTDHIVPHTLAEAHRRWGRAQSVSTPVPMPDPDGPLRVGYLSADFFDHPVARFLEPVLEGHDRRKVRPVAISTGRRRDAVTDRIRTLADNWIDIQDLSDSKAAAMLRQAGIHILVDLSGHTAGNRMGLLAHRPAPIQIAYLGYPATTGLPAIDFRITDSRADPADADGQCTEALVRLPGGFLCYRPPPDAPPLMMRAPNTAPTIGSFNNLAKVTPSLLDCWADILRAAPETRLLLKFRSLADPFVRSDMTARLVRRGIAADRLDLLGHLPSRDAHMAAYGRLDLALDTFPYNGTTTTCEALWMGVPVVTLAGRAHAGRVGVSILTMIGRRQWIAESPVDYRDRVCRLLADPDTLARERTVLRQAMAASPLMDEGQTVAELEAAYMAVWKRRTTPRPPAMPVSLPNVDEFPPE